MNTASQRLRLLAAAFATLIVSACTAFPTLAERTALLAPTLEYYAPEPRGGRAPLVILVSGCGGLHGLQGRKTVMKNYAGAATRANALGEEDQIPGSEFKYDPEGTQRARPLLERLVRDQAEGLR